MLTLAPEHEINTDPEHAHILVVDDEPANVKLLEQILRGMGFVNVASTLDAREVVDLYRRHAHDLIILDLNMPQLDGFAVMQQLREAAGDGLPPILVLTAQHAQSWRQRALDEGARDFVTKPFYTDELIARVRNLLDAHMAQKYMRHQNEILEEKVRQRSRALHDTRLKVIRHLGRAAEYRDNETGLHIIRMSKISVVVAQAAGLDRNACDLLLNAAPMHDIGKIGIPDHILLKPGKLDAREWEIMKTHAQIGADILSDDDSDLMIMAHEIALTHHEKWDGSGYPNGLRGRDIPLAGRITALADVFDALTSVRPYKQAWPVERAVELIKNERGRHFDPQLADYFIDGLPRIVEIIEKYAEPEVSTHG